MYTYMVRILISQVFILQHSNESRSSVLFERLKIPQWSGILSRWRYIFPDTFTMNFFLYIIHFNELKR